jgi:hypothetical protein
VDAIQKQLLSRNKVSLALDGWTSTNKLPITSGIAYCMDRYWALQDVPLAFDEVGSPFFPYFESSLRITGQGSVTGPWLGGHLLEVFDCFELSDGRLIGITTDNVSSNYSMTCELQTTLEGSPIMLHALRNHIPCMPHIIPVAFGAFMTSLGVKGPT